MRITFVTAVFISFFHATFATAILPKLSNCPDIVDDMWTSIASPPRIDLYKNGNAIIGVKPVHHNNKIIINKARKLLRYLHVINKYPMGGHDTLIDLNGDQYKDILIEFYGLAGTGEKNCIKVFLYDKEKKQFIENEQLNNLCNPAFYFKKKIVTGYYIAYGGGDAAKLRWNGLKLDTLEMIDVETLGRFEDQKFKLKIHNYVSKAKKVVFTEILTLPKEYRYCNYRALIRREGLAPSVTTEFR